jgi:membrane protease YdiL (CAAX protease family)
VTPYVALAILPLSSCLTLNPVRFSWGLCHGLEPIPLELVERVQLFDRYVLFIRDVLTISFVAGLMFWQSVPAAHVGLRLDEWKSNVAIGVVAGVLHVAISSVLTTLVPAAGNMPAMAYMRKGPIPLWIFLLITGAFAEEFWIAICLVVFRDTGYSTGLAVVFTAAVFGAMHFEYHFGGALALAMIGAISCLLFLWTGSLFATCLFHCIRNLGILYRLRRSM